MNNDLIRGIGEGASVSVIISTIFGWLPAMAALASIAWYGVLFYDRFKKRTEHRRRGERKIS
jgi:hypothetical protein